MDLSPMSSTSSSSSSSEDRATKRARQRRDDDELLHLIIACAEQENDSNYRRGKKQTRHNFNDARYCVERDYLGDSPLFTDEQFRKRFRGSKQCYANIKQKLSASNRFFQEIPEGVTKRYGVLGTMKMPALPKWKQR